MRPSLDHLVYATPDVDATVEELAAVLGVRAGAGGRHAGIGTRNALLDLGDGTYLEVIGVDREADARPPEGPRPFGLDRIEQPRLAAWAAGTDDIGERVARARAQGYDPGSVRPMSRLRPDGVELHWRLTPPSAEAIELVPFLIDWGETPHPSTTAPAGCRLVGFSGEHPEPEAVRCQLDSLGVELSVKAAGAAVLIAVVEGPGGVVELR